jgi:putative ATP-binding cassette transporter
VDWVSTLSLGEVQRLGFLRLCYHAPSFALLDEATSALDVASETQCMRLVADRGITVISVAHRLTAPAFHKNILRMSSSASPTLSPNPAWVPVRI